MTFGQEPAATSLTCATTGTAPQLSLTLPPAKFATGTSPSHCTVNGAGQASIGGVVSCTVMICVQSFVLPLASVAR